MTDAPARGFGFWRRIPRSVRSRIGFLLAANLAILSFIYWRSGGAASFSNEVGRMAPNVAPTVLAGLGLTGIICCGSLDLSIGAILGVAGTVFGILHSRGVGHWPCFIACFCTATALSAYNGLLIRLLRLPAIIVTLAGLAFYRGIALILADVGTRGFSEQFTLQGESVHTLGKQYSGHLLLVVLLAAVAWECFGKSPRTWLAVGNSQIACRLSGLQPERIVFQAFLVSGLYLGLAAILDISNHITIEPARLGLGFELTVIAAVVLGGTSIFGGQGSYLGTALGGLFLYLIEPAMLYAGVNEYWRTTLQGGAILAVIGVDCRIGRRGKREGELR